MGIEQPTSPFGDDVRYSWTQPCCENCWTEHNPGRTPVKMVEQYRETEVCVYCGNTHTSGIYVRVDPKEASYPSLVKT